ncbi:helix-turn-helix domain protein [Anaerotignum neopropionicum]|uniref:Helix-turn-helix domain protein n=1 Tax=Anaerotignum neopropionicum TaxID=36847 RepID=A0A136WES8_9FIRM|nr:helix-turn-helix domain-containing protein [Anaerotignum neopropionicum]KXL52953.1 helix-turn-helix domain protein [Anaerotignum neopropionicum]
MSFFISNKQAAKYRPSAQPLAPILLDGTGIQLQRRIFPHDHEHHNFILDTFEIANLSGEELHYPLIPNGYMSLYFILGNNASHGYVGGVLTFLRKLRIMPRSVAYCVHLHPDVVHWLFDIPANDLTDRALPLEQFLPQIDVFLNELKRGESFHERNILLSGYLNGLNAAQFSPMALVSRCVGIILENQGVIKVAEIAAIVGCSERYLNRVFQEHVGVSTKLFSEMTQLQFSLHNILATSPKSLLNTAVSFGYFDQTHMNRSYQKFLDCTACDMRYANAHSLTWNTITNIL